MLEVYVCRARIIIKVTRDEEKEQAQSMIVGPNLRAVLKLESQVGAS